MVPTTLYLLSLTHTNCDCGELIFIRHLDDQFQLTNASLADISTTLKMVIPLEISHLAHHLMNYQRIGCALIVDWAKRNSKKSSENVVNVRVDRSINNSGFLAIFSENNCPIIFKQTKTGIAPRSKGTAYHALANQTSISRSY